MQILPAESERGEARATAQCMVAQITVFWFTWCHADAMWSARVPAIAAYSWMRALRRELS